MARGRPCDVLDLDDPDLRVDRTERDPFGVLGRVMVVAEPRFAGMPVLAHDQAVEPQLGKAPVPGGDPRREHVLHRGFDDLDDPLLEEGGMICGPGPSGCGRS